MKQTFNQRSMKFIDKTSSAKSKEENGRTIWPSIKLMVKVSKNIPFSHRIYR